MPSEEPFLVPARQQALPEEPLGPGQLPVLPMKKMRTLLPL